MGRGRAVPNVSLPYGDRNCLATAFYEEGGQESLVIDSVDFQHIKPALYALEQLHKISSYMFRQSLGAIMSSPASKELLSKSSAVSSTVTNLPTY